MNSRHMKTTGNVEVIIHQQKYRVVRQAHLKGQSNEIFYLDFFTVGILSSPLLGFKRLFEFGFEFGGIFTIFD